VFAEAFAGDHYWDRGFGDKVVGKGAKDHTRFHQLPAFQEEIRTYPLSALLPLLPKITNVGEI
jgi:hypothetical protein